MYVFNGIKGITRLINADNLQLCLVCLRRCAIIGKPNKAVNYWLLTTLGHQMKVACITTANELCTKNLGLIVLPEGVDTHELEKAKLAYPDAIIAGAIEENGYSRGIILHRGENQIEYLKVETDCRTKGSGNIKQSPIYKSDNVCIGLLICMDIDSVPFSIEVLNAIKSCPAKLKILCIPGDMGAEWLGGDRLPFPNKYEGVHVILCNHVKTHGARCKSFVTDSQGWKIKSQCGVEPIYAELP